MLNAVDQQFHDLYERLLNEGHIKGDRTGHGTRMLPGQMMRFDCRDGRIPILSTRLIPTKAFRHEMLWFISGNSSIKYPRDHKIGIWDSWQMPGTAVYDDPVERELSVEERLKLPQALERFDEIDFILSSMVKNAESLGSAQLTMVAPDGEVHEYRNLSQTTYMEFAKWLDVSEIPRTQSTPAGEKISLQRRLQRVSKNDTQKWDAINAALVPDSMVDWDGQTWSVNVFKNGRFVNIAIDHGQFTNLVRELDHLQVPDYELLDADIGAGGYGPQWRRWQDTQIVTQDQLDDYVSQGYLLKGTLQSGAGWDEGLLVVHREIDQLQNAIKMLNHNPDDRRIIVTAWNPALTWKAALPPCHLYVQFVTWEFDDLEYVVKLISRNGLMSTYLSEGVEEASKGPGDHGTDEWHMKFAKEFCIRHGLPTRHISCFVLLRS